MKFYIILFAGSFYLQPCMGAQTDPELTVEQTTDTAEEHNHKTPRRTGPFRQYGLYAAGAIVTVAGLAWGLSGGWSTGQKLDPLPSPPTKPLPSFNSATYQNIALACGITNGPGYRPVSDPQKRQAATTYLESLPEKALSELDQLLSGKNNPLLLEIKKAYATGQDTFLQVLQVKAVSLRHTAFTAPSASDS